MRLEAEKQSCSYLTKLKQVSPWCQCLFYCHLSVPPAALCRGSEPFFMLHVTEKWSDPLRLDSFYLGNRAPRSNLSLAMSLTRFPLQFYSYCPLNTERTLDELSWKIWAAWSLVCSGGGYTSNSRARQNTQSVIQKPEIMHHEDPKKSSSCEHSAAWLLLLMCGPHLSGLELAAFLTMEGTATCFKITCSVCWMQIPGSPQTHQNKNL
jgi:hypothetical protein